MSNYPWSSAWVVGASTGLGGETAKQLSSNGVKTFISARTEDKLCELAQGNSFLVPKPLDITNLDEAKSRAEEIVRELGHLPDLIILNAAIYAPMDVGNFSPKDINDMMSVNYQGYVNMMSTLLPYRYSGRNSLVASVASPSGWRGLPGNLGYGPGKAALINLMESLKSELAGSSLDIRVINPGFIKTRLTAKNEFSMPQLMTPEFAATKMLKGLCTNKFDIAFPNPLIAKLRFLRLLPYSLYFRIASKLKKEVR